MALAVLLILLFFRKTFRPVKLAEVLKFDAMRRFFSVNGDIIVRTFCNVGVYTFFTAASARMGNDAVLAVNTVLMQCLMLFSYMSDGFAYAAEAMTGRFVGAKDLPSLKKCLRYCVIWTFTTAAIAVTAYVVGWDELFVAFMESGSEADIAEILKVAERYVGWIIAIPIFAAMPFMLDGVMAGATLTRVMRNSMFWATVAFFAIYYVLLPVIGNDALWLAFTLYIILRLVLQYFMSHRLEDIYKKAER